MSISIETLIQVATALVSAGGVLWKLSERLKHLELENQANYTRLEQQIAAINTILQAHVARAEERHQSTKQRLEDHALELANNRNAHASLRQTLDKHGNQLAAIRGEA